MAGEVNDIEEIFSDTSTEQRSVPVKYYDQFDAGHHIGMARIFWTQGRKVIVLDGGIGEEIHEVVVKPPSLKVENGFIQ